MRFDVIIIGAGLNGLAAALALGASGLARPLKVALVDRQDPVELASKRRDTRGSAVTAATQTMLKTLGAWQQIAPHAEEMRNIIVTDGQNSRQERPVLMSFATEDGKAAAASIVENHALFAGLLEAVQASPHITLLTGKAVASAAFGPGLATVTLEGNETLKAELIVGADGRASRTRDAAGIKVESKPYGQTAITFTLAHELEHHGRAEEHFTSDGVLAVLPLPGKLSSIVWAQSDAAAEEAMALDDDPFLVRLTETLGTHLGALTLAGSRAAYPLGLQIAHEFVAPRLALVGDAAHVIHPLAGLGLNLGFKDAASLADCLSEASALGQDIGSVAVLENYVRQRRFDTTMTSIGLDGMNFLFANNNPLLKVVRDTGLMLVDKLPFAKDLLMKEAAGRTGTPPRLMRGLTP